MIYLNIIVALQIIFIFSILFFKNNNHLNKILAIIILIPGLNFISNALNLSDLLSTSFFGFVFFFTLITSILFAPFIFYYINLMCANRLKKWRFLYVISLFIICYMTYLGIQFFGYSHQEQIVFINGLKNGTFPQGVEIANLLFVVMQQVYFTIAAIKVYYFKKQLANIFSSSSNVKIEFTQKFILLIWILNIITIVLYGTLPMHVVEFIVLPFVLFFINSFLVFYAFQYQVVFNDDIYEVFKKDIALMKHVLDVDKTEHKNKGLEKNIVDFLDVQKKYLQHDYTVFDLAKDLNKPQRIVSDTINQEIGKTFSDLINSYRIEESKNLLLEKSESLTIEAIAELSGFKSRATFYRVFKDKTNLTPAQYIKGFKLVS